MASVHVVYRNENHTIDFEEMFPEERYQAIGISEGQEVTPATITEAQVKAAVAQHFEVGIGEFEDHFVEINSSTSNITVRPEASFGE